MRREAPADDPCQGSTSMAAMLFWALLASGQIRMRRVDGWQSRDKPISHQPIALAA